MLDGLFVTPAVTAITEALDSAKAEGAIAVVGNLKLAQAFGAKREVVPIGLTARAAKKLATNLADTSSLPDRSLAAVVGIDIATADDWSTTLQAWSRVVRDGGALILLDRGHASEASRRALCAGLTELEQRHAGRLVVTSGLVTHL